MDCDAEILRVIIRNLLSNAIKFTPHYGKISFYYHENALIVEDSGVGMSAEKLSTIKLDSNFESTSGTENEKGIGGFAATNPILKTKTDAWMPRNNYIV